MPASVTLAYDALGRQISEASVFGTNTTAYDLAGRRTRLTHNDGFFVSYDYLVTGEVSAIREYGAASGAGVLGTYAYDNLGNRTSLTRGNGTVTSYAYDPATRLTGFTHDLSGTAQDVTSSFTYNSASQIASRTRSNDAFAWSQAVAVNRAYVNNGLNQHTQSGAVALGYDGRGNLTGSGATTYLYSAENRLASVLDSGGSRLFSYDALGRLAFTNGAALTYFEYDDTQVTRELSATVVLRRYVYGPGTDEPLVWYEGAGTADRRWLHADERGSVIAVTNASGASIAVNSYDDYGIPASTNLGRFQYTGQAWIPELGMYYYKARMYLPTVGATMVSTGGTIVSGSGLIALTGAVLEGVGGNPSNAAARGVIRFIFGRLKFLGPARPFASNPPNRLARRRSEIPACL